jgi:hypothetical protein
MEGMIYMLIQKERRYLVFLVGAGRFELPTLAP